MSCDKNITFNILGSCVCRDSFAFQDNDGGYKINFFVQNFSCLHALDEGLELDKTKYDSYNDSSLPNFYKRCIYLDVTKNIFNFLTEYKSDYLIIDISNVRSPYIKFENGPMVSYGLKPYINKMIESDILPAIEDEYTFDHMPLKEVKKRTIKYINRIKDLYKEDKK